MKEFNRPTMLMILDGYGINQDTYGNAIAAADKPHLDEIFTKYPGTTLKACGLDVGLPEGQMGNSEVGHLNIGAGRIVYQDLTMITKAIEDGSFFENEALQKAMAHVKENHSALHLLGLLSDGGVHSHISHLFALIDMAKKEGIENLYVHCFLDGRDVPPRCAEKYMSAGRSHEKNRSRYISQPYPAATMPWIVTNAGIVSKKPTTLWRAAKGNRLPTVHLQ